MEYVKLGRSGIEVSRVALGCMGFGDPRRGNHTWTLEEPDAEAVIAYALERGVTYFDTSPTYSNGTSEQYLGRSLAKWARREDVVISTKFEPRPREDYQRGIDGAEHVKRSLHQSLKNLGTDYVDLYICHMWDWHTPFEELYDGLAECVRAGKIRAIGMSNVFSWQLARVADYGRSHGLPPVACYQGHYNLIAREIEREMLHLCRADGMGVTAFSPLASGRLARAIHHDDTLRFLADEDARAKYDATFDVDALVIRRVGDMAGALGVTRTEVSLAWLLSKVDAPIVGATSCGQVEQAVRAVDLSLTPDMCGYLEELYPPHDLVGVMATNNSELCA